MPAPGAVSAFVQLVHPVDTSHNSGHMFHQGCPQRELTNSLTAHGRMPPQKLPVKSLPDVQTTCPSGSQTFVSSDDMSACRSASMYSWTQARPALLQLMLAEQFCQPARASVANKAAVAPAPAVEAAVTTGHS
jgi:hypothetical protein